MFQDWAKILTYTSATNIIQCWLLQHLECQKASRHGIQQGFDQFWNNIVISSYHLGIYIHEDFTFFVTKSIFNTNDGPIYYPRTFIPNDIDATTWFRMVLTQRLTRIDKDSLNLKCSPNTKVWLILQFWCSRLVPLISLLIPWMHICSGPTLVLTKCEYKHLENFSPKIIYLSQSRQHPTLNATPCLRT